MRYYCCALILIFISIQPFTFSSVKIGVKNKVALEILKIRGLPANLFDSLFINFKFRLDPALNRIACKEQNQIILFGQPSHHAEDLMNYLAHHKSYEYEFLVFDALSILTEPFVDIQDNAFSILFNQAKAKHTQTNKQVLILIKNLDQIEQLFLEKIKFSLFYSLDKLKTELKNYINDPNIFVIFTAQDYKNIPTTILNYFPPEGIIELPSFNEEDKKEFFHFYEWKMQMPDFDLQRLNEYASHLRHLESKYSPENHSDKIIKKMQEIDSLLRDFYLESAEFNHKSEQEILNAFKAIHKCENELQNFIYENNIIKKNPLFYRFLDFFRTSKTSYLSRVKNYLKEEKQGLSNILYEYAIDASKGLEVSHLANLLSTLLTQAKNNKASITKEYIDMQIKKALDEQIEKNKMREANYKATLEHIKIKFTPKPKQIFKIMSVGSKFLIVGTGLMAGYLILKKITHQFKKKKRAKISKPIA